MDKLWALLIAGGFILFIAAIGIFALLYVFSKCICTGKTNETKYTTVKEREKAFYDFCMKRKCTNCPNNKLTLDQCAFHWLAMPVDDEEEPNEV